MTEHIEVEAQAGVLTIAMRGGQVQTLPPQDTQTVSRAIDLANRDATVSAVLIQFDGDVRPGSAAPSASKVVFGPEPLLLAIGSARKPLVAAVCGRAGGAAMAMLLYCDLVYVAEDCLLSCPTTDFAPSLQTPYSQLLAARIGHVRAFELMALDRAIDARTAVDWGIANAAVGPAQVVAHAKAAAQALAARGYGADASFPHSRLSFAEACRDMRTWH
jgi:enoyl-CoA hydratase/carnithine racemase